MKQIRKDWKTLSALTSDKERVGGIFLKHPIRDNPMLTKVYWKIVFKYSLWGFAILIAFVIFIVLLIFFLSLI